VEQGDRRVLHRLIREVRAQIERDELEALGGSPSPAPAPALAAAAPRQTRGSHHQEGGEGQLLDLDEHDGDLLQHHHAFALSPISEQAHAAAAQAAAAAAAAAGASRPSLAPAAPAAADPSSFPSDPPKIRVVVRKRPINRREVERGDEDVVEVLAPEGEDGATTAPSSSSSPPAPPSLLNRGRIAVHESKLRVDLVRYVDRHAFTFDAALDETVTSEQVYALTVQPLVATLLRGGKATCFAYGQTGSGKTHTMSPLPIRAAQDVLSLLSLPEHRDIRLHLACFEIYGNRCFDLLNGRAKLSALEDAKRQVVVVGLKEAEVGSVAQVEELIAAAHSQRSTGSTAANADSSRSHCIMQFALKKPNPNYAGGVVYGAAAAAAQSAGAAAAGAASAAASDQEQFAVPCTPADKICVVGKISFIDLAGSERGADTYDNNRQTRMEGAEINKSLLALKECIRALDCDARHVPFRGSKLTAVLRDSFVGGNARTVMVANISPTASCVEHTLNTLRYADRVKELRKAAKGERTRGGVTPGEGDYYASVERGLGGGAGGAGGGGAGGGGGGGGVAGGAGAAAGLLPSSGPGASSSSSLLPPLQPPAMAMAAARAGSGGSGSGQPGRRASVASDAGPAGALGAAARPAVAGGGSFSGRSAASSLAAAGPPSKSSSRASLGPGAPTVLAAAAAAARPSAAAAPPPPPRRQQPPRGIAASASKPPAAGPYGSSASSAAAMAAAAAAAANDFFEDEEEQERALRDLEDEEQRLQQQQQRRGLDTAAAADDAADNDDGQDDGGAGEDDTLLPNSSASLSPPPTASQRAALARRRDALMERILEDEEEIVALHRRQIEASMDVVRREMQILAEVDRPGSAIDAYVDALEGVLESKAASVRQLQARLGEFRAKLREEERLSARMKAAAAAAVAEAAAGSAGRGRAPGALPAAAAAAPAGKRERVGRALGRLVGRV
jgi:kinesin family protein 2/24